MALAPPPPSPFLAIGGTAFRRASATEVVSFDLFTAPGKWWIALRFTEDGETYSLTTAWGPLGGTARIKVAHGLEAEECDDILLGCRKRRLAHGYDHPVNWERPDGICIETIFNWLSTLRSFREPVETFAQLGIELVLAEDADPTPEDLALEERLEELKHQPEVGMSKSTAKLVPGALANWRKGLSL